MNGPRIGDESEGLNSSELTALKWVLLGGGNRSEERGEVGEGVITEILPKCSRVS